MPFSTCAHCLSATLLPCALGVIGLNTGTGYKLNYLTSCLCSEWSHIVHFVANFILLISLLSFVLLFIMLSTLKCIYRAMLLFFVLCTFFFLCVVYL